MPKPSNNQIIGIPVWRNLVSPLFDEADKLLVITLQGGREIARTKESLDNFTRLKRAGRLRELGVQILLCGALSHELSVLISNTKIKVIPFLKGRIEDVLSAFLADDLLQDRFFMPGYLSQKEKSSSSLRKPQPSYSNPYLDSGFLAESRGSENKSTPKRRTKQ